MDLPKTTLVQISHTPHGNARHAGLGKFGLRLDVKQTELRHIH